MIDKYSNIKNLYKEFKNMPYLEQIEFAQSLESEEERNFFHELANVFMRDRFVKVVEEGKF